MKMLEKLFGFNPRETRVRTEILAGITTFLTMAYIWLSIPTFWRLQVWIRERFSRRQSSLRLLLRC